jgi:hypothetical protein
MNCPKTKIEVCEYFGIKVNPHFCALCIKGDQAHKEKLKSVIEEHEKMNKRIMAETQILTSPKDRQPPTDEQIKLVYQAISDVFKKQNKISELIDADEYFKRRKICIACNGGYKCLPQYYCCGIEANLALKKWVCKAGKF